MLDIVDSEPVLPYQTNSFVGTEEYIAPEVDICDGKEEPQNTCGFHGSHEIGLLTVPAVDVSALFYSVYV